MNAQVHLMMVENTLTKMGVQPPSREFIKKHCNIAYKTIVERVWRRYREFSGSPGSPGSPGTRFGNPLYDEWKKIFDAHSKLDVPPGDTRFLFLCRVEDPYFNYWSAIIGLMAHCLNINTDRPVIDRVSWGIPSEEVLTYMITVCQEQKRDLVEIGSGKGYWLRLLRDRVSGTPGMSGTPDIFGYDTTVPQQDERFTAVAHGDHIYAMSQHPGANILLCWPPGNDQCGIELSAVAATHCKGDLFYVGEPSCINPLDGQLLCMCTATIEFFRVLGAKWDLVRKIAMPKWSAIGDDFYHYRRKPQA